MGIFISLEQLLLGGWLNCQNDCNSQFPSSVLHNVYPWTQQNYQEITFIVLPIEIYRKYWKTWFSIKKQPVGILLLYMINYHYWTSNRDIAVALKPFPTTFLVHKIAIIRQYQQVIMTILG